MKRSKKGEIAAVILCLGAVFFSAGCAEDASQAAEMQRPGPMSEVGLERLLDQPPVPDQLAAPIATPPQGSNNALAPPPDPSGLIRAFRCTVILEPSGTAIDVAVVSDPNLNNISVAERLPGGNDLVIYYNAQRMNRFQPVTRLFWLEHECSHHTLGHTLETGGESDTQLGEEEDQADCTAIQTMVTGLAGQPPMIDRAERAAIEDDLTRLMPGGGYYKPGAVRAQQIEACAQAVGG